METKLKTKLPTLIRRVRLLKRQQYRYDAYIVRKHKIRFNDTPIPHQIDRDLKDFDHKNFTGLYFKYYPYYGHFREVLVYCTINAGPAKAIEFIKTLSEQSQNQLAFYRQIKFEFSHFLNDRILKSTKDHIQVFANTLWGEKMSKAPAEFVVREVLLHAEHICVKLEAEFSKSVFDNSPIYFNPKKIKEFLMIQSIGLELGLIEFREKGFKQVDYFKLIGKMHHLDIKDNPSANKNDAIKFGSYHFAVNDFIKLLKNYEKSFKKKRNLNDSEDSGIKW